VSDHRQELRDALSSSFPADEACRAALDGGASVRTSSDTAHRDHLVTIYTRRAKHLNQIGARTVGTDEFIDRLDAADGPLRIASVDDDEWHFVVFLSTDGRVVSTWGVEARAREAATDS
jgi:hypothetical protein